MKKYQVNDNTELLIKMMQDLKNEDSLYRPGKYWLGFQDRFVEELKKKGLKNFRRRKNSVLSSFAATEHLDLRYRFKTLFKSSKLIANGFFKLAHKFGLKVSFNYNAEDITKYFYTLTKKKFNENSLEINQCGTNRFGNPESIIELNGALWTFAHLQYCSMFIDTFKHINFKEQMIFCELGSGMGRNIEVMAKLYPKGTFFVIDIPPQLYVAEQYLSSVFGDSRVIGYSDTNKLKLVDKELLKKLKGKIIIIPSWKIAQLEDLNIDVFWNSASFQEMEPKIVYNYLKIVKNMNPNYIYINAVPEGLKGFTSEVNTKDHYVNSLNEEFDLISEYETDNFLAPDLYKSYVWKQKPRL